MKRTRILRSLAAVTAAVAAASVVALHSGPAWDTPVQLTQQTESAVQVFGRCVLGQHSGDLLLLIDESRSLAGPGGSDAQGRRVDAARLMLKQMSRFAEWGRVELNVQLAGFASEFAESTPWTVLNPGSLADLTSQAESFRSRDKGFDTDYWMALDGARQSLAARPRSGEGKRCQAIAWFSDGELDIQPREEAQDRIDHDTARPYAPGLDLTKREDADKAEGIAAESLCRESGVADQVRSQGIVMFAVGLSSPAAKKDFTLMRAIATGESFKGAPCGKISSPTPGDFHEAPDIKRLLDLFDVNTPPPPLVNDNVNCPADVARCPIEDKHTFVLDESIDRVNILASTDRPGIQLSLAAPDGKVHQLPLVALQRDAQVDLGDIKLNYSWPVPDSATIDLFNPGATAAGWTGQWALAFVDPAAQSSGGQSRSNIHISANVVPDWINRAQTPTLVAGTTVSGVQFGLTKTDKITKVDPKGTVSLSAILVDQEGNETPVAANLSKAAIANPVELDLTKVKPGSATLRLALDLTTAAVVKPGGGEIPGTPLSPQQVDIPLKISTRGPDLPSEIPFGDHQFSGPSDESWEIETTVPFPGPGCVWVDPAAGITTDGVPDRVTNVSVKAVHATSGPTCARAEVGQRGELKLRLIGRGAGQGTLSGAVPVSVAPLSSPGEAQTVNVPFTANLLLPVDVVKFGMAFLLVFLAGIGIPVGLLYLMQWLGQRIPNDPPLYVKRMPVSIQGQNVLRTDDGGAFALGREDLRHFAERFGRGGLKAEEAAVELRPRLSWNPFAAGHVSLVDTTGRRTAGNSSTDERSYGKQHRARLPLVVRDTWVLIHDPHGPEDQAEIVVFLASSAGERECEVLARSVLSNARDRLEALRGLAETAGGGPDGYPGPSMYADPPVGLGYEQPAAPPYGYGPPPTDTAPASAGPYGPSPGYDAPPQNGPPGANGAETWPSGTPYGPPADSGEGGGPQRPYGPPPTSSGSPWPT